MSKSLPTFLDSLKCPICKDYVERAVETRCCGQAYCERCIQPLLYKNCPSCRIPNVDSDASKTIRRLVNEMPANCPNECEQNITRGNLQQHLEVCPQKKYQCLIGNCRFSGLFDALVQHMAKDHSREVFSSVMKCKDKVDDGMQTEKAKIFYCPFEACAALGEMTSEVLKRHIPQQHSRDQAWFDEILHFERGRIKVRNSAGRDASMAQNGKFYCGFRLGSFTRNENVPNGHSMRISCIYENKLNCWSCMQLDVAMRNLQYGSLVNGSGRAAKPIFCNHGGNRRNANAATLCNRPTCRDRASDFGCGVHLPMTEAGRNDFISIVQGLQQFRRRGTIHESEISVCTTTNMCTDCRQLSYVLHIRDLRRMMRPADYYKPVWSELEAGVDYDDTPGDYIVFPGFGR